MTTIHNSTKIDTQTLQYVSDVPESAAVISRKREHLFAIFLLLIVLLFYYRDIVFENKTFLQLNYAPGTMPYLEGDSAYGYPSSAEPVADYPADPGAMAWASEPLIRRAAQIFWDGEVPLWNPNQGLGEPYLADGNSAVFEPLQFAFYAIPEQFWPYAMDIQVLLRFLLSGVFGYLFVRQLGLPLLPAVFAGASYMLSSYFIAFGNHPQMRAETLLPFALYSFERLAQRRTITHLLLVTGTTAWVLIASFPESGFLVLALAALWYGYRAFWQSFNARLAWDSLARLIIRLVVAVAVGVLLTAFFWLPLIENIQNSLHIHEGATGLVSLPAVYAILSVSRPMIAHAIWTPHFYITTLFLAIICIGAVLRKGAHRQTILFFGVYGIVFYLKIYGFPLVQWIGYLPGFSQIQMTKYTVPSISFCFSILGAFGINAMITKHASVHWLLIFLLFTLSILVYATARTDSGFNVVRLIAGLLIFVGISLLIYILSVSIYNTKFNGWYVSSAFILLVMLESTVWYRQSVRPIRYDPFTEPNFIHFIKSQSTPARVFGYDRILHPGIATAYNVDDIRFLSALVAEKRFLYVSQFITPSEIIATYLMQPGDSISRETATKIAHVLSAPENEGIPYASSLADRLTRLQGYENPTYLGKYTDLLNMKYVLASKNTPLLRSVSLLDLLTDPADERKALNQQELTIGSEMRVGFILPPPSRTPIDILLPSGNVSLHFAIGLDPSSWTQAHISGSGAAFKLTIEDQQGEHEVFARTLDPTRLPADQQWIDAAVDLSRWSGQRVRLNLITGPGRPALATNAPTFWATPVLRVEDEVTPWALQNLTPIKRIDVNAALLDNNLSKQGTGFDMISVTLDRERRSAISMQAEHFADLDVQVPQTGAMLTFGVGKDPKSWSETTIGSTRFRVMVIDGTTSTDVYTHTANPGNDVQDRHWIDARVDLAAWRGRMVRLRFSAKSEPQDSATNNLAYWSNIQLSGDGIALANPELARFQLVYNDEIAIYQNNFAYPRAFVVHAMIAVQDSDQAIREMAQPAFNPATQAIVEGEIPNHWTQSLLANQAAFPPSEAHVSERTANTMRITTTLETPGMLVVSESYAPGWQAYVDGQLAPIAPTDGFLRGVYLDAGKHEIRFVYAPRSFAIGTVISLTTLGALIMSVALILIAKRRKQKIGQTHNEHTATN